MAKTIQLAVTFPAPPARLYRLYLSAREHSAACGWGMASIDARPGGRMRMATHISGRFLALVPGQMIVQTWRGADWKRSEPDSVLILTFQRAPKGCTVRMVHVNVPDAHARGITDGWRKYYWRPWRAYLQRKGSR